MKKKVLGKLLPGKIALPETLKLTLTLTQTLAPTVTGGQFSSGTIVRIPKNAFKNETKK